MPYLWLKALHIIFVVAWFAGLFYLPRLFVYHCDVDDSVANARFQLMERRLYLFTLMNTASAVACGAGLVIEQPFWLTQTWMQIKVALVLALLDSSGRAGALSSPFGRDATNTTGAGTVGITKSPPCYFSRS